MRPEPPMSMDRVMGPVGFAVLGLGGLGALDFRGFGVITGIVLRGGWGSEKAGTRKAAWWSGLRPHRRRNKVALGWGTVLWCADGILKTRRVGWLIPYTESCLR